MLRRVLAVAVLGLLACAWAKDSKAQELYGTLKKIKESGVITIGRSEQSVPFSFLDASGQPIGYSIDLCMKIVEGVKEELKLDKLEVKYVTVMGTTLIPLIFNGTVDMACTTTTMTLG